MFERVMAALQSWGQWANSDNEVGWPPESVISRMVEYGCLGAAQKSFRGLDVSEFNEEVDRMVSQLDKSQQKVVHRKFRYWEAPEASAKQLRMSLEQYNGHLTAAYRVLDVKLELLEARAAGYRPTAKTM